MKAKSAAIYVDASVILRMVFATPGPRAPITNAISTSSQVVEVEAFRSLESIRLAGELNDLELARKHRELSALLGRLHLFPVSDEVIQRARAPFPLPVKALHALHVSTALQVSAEVDSLEFWTHDEASAAAAITAGLEVRGIRSAG